jgi:hypothetical protein
MKATELRPNKQDLARLTVILAQAGYMVNGDMESYLAEITNHVENDLKVTYPPELKDIEEER